MNVQPENINHKQNLANESVFFCTSLYWNCFPWWYYRISYRITPLSLFPLLKQQNIGKPGLLLSGKQNADLPFPTAASGNLAILAVAMCWVSYQCSARVIILLLCEPSEVLHRWVGTHSRACIRSSIHQSHKAVMPQHIWKSSSLSVLYLSLYQTEIQQRWHNLGL